MKQTKKIVEPAFPVVMYEVEKLLKQGWQLSQEREPIYIGGLYDVELTLGDEAQQEINEALDRDDEEDAAKYPEKESKPAAKRGPKPKAQ